MSTNSQYHVLSFKDLLITALLFILLPFTIQAQLLIGAEVGGTRSNLTTPNNLAPGASWNFHFGFSAGVFLDLPISGDISLQPEIQYIQKGFNLTGSSTSPVTWKNAVTNSYIEVPVYVKYKLCGNELRWYLLGGPTLGYLLSSNSEINNYPGYNGNHDTKNMYKSYDLTISVGVGLEYPLPSGYYLVPTLRYYHGVIKVDEPPSGIISATSQSYSRTIQLTVGIIFPISQ
jgi:hypothetical protein